MELAQNVKEISQFAKEHKITIAVMGCRVNGPGETDDADLGLWCGPTTVNLKEKDRLIGSFGYAEVLPVIKKKIEEMVQSISERSLRQAQ